MPRRRKPSLPAITAALRADNIATPSQPVLRLRVVTPITPFAVRAQIVEDAADSRRPDRYISRRLTSLDKRLSDDQALALERYANAQAVFLCGYRGASGEYCDKGKPGGSPPFSESQELELRAAAAAKKSMSPPLRAAAEIFVDQMINSRSSVSPAQAGFLLGGKTAEAYFAAVQRLAEHLAIVYASIGRNKSS